MIRLLLQLTALLLLIGCQTPSRQIVFDQEALVGAQPFRYVVSVSDSGKTKTIEHNGGKSSVKREFWESVPEEDFTSLYLMEHINAHRHGLGLKKLKADMNMVRAAGMHAHYLAYNKPMQGHDQLQGYGILPGYEIAALPIDRYKYFVPGSYVSMGEIVLTFFSTSRPQLFNKPSDQVAATLFEMMRSDEAKKLENPSYRYFGLAMKYHAEVHQMEAFEMTVYKISVVLTLRE